MDKQFNINKLVAIWLLNLYIEGILQAEKMFLKYQYNALYKIIIVDHMIFALIVFTGYM